MFVMSRKRKRKTITAPSSTNKRIRVDANNGNAHRSITGLLRQYYNEACTLRQYLVCMLPQTAKGRRRHLLQYGLAPDQQKSDTIEAEVKFLDTTFVGSLKHVPLEELAVLEKDLAVFTQQLTESTAALSVTPGALKQTEIVDFCVWKLFRRHNGGGGRLTHLLCGGYHTVRSDMMGAESNAIITIPGVQLTGTNRYVEALKQHPWTILCDLLASRAEHILSNLFLECGIFTMLNDTGNAVQISGRPLSELKTISRRVPTAVEEAVSELSLHSKGANQLKVRGLSDIRFARYRMLYAKAQFDAGDNRMQSGMCHAHVLRRYCNLHNEDETVHIAKYIFPRQFGLHNVFDSAVDARETSHRFKDYTIREEEIERAIYKFKCDRRSKGKTATRESEPIPRRLRGETLRLIHRIRTRHVRCSYGKLLEYYCPRRDTHTSSSSSCSSFDLACPEADVSAFCRAIVSSVFGHACFGSVTNHRNIGACIDRFIRLRRFESMTLIDVMEGVSVSQVKWLVPPNVRKDTKLSRSDFEKRKQLLAELLYYLFDSFLIPLIRSHFHVTESNVHRNRLFYFRQDVWRRMCEPVLRSLKSDMLENYSMTDSKRTMSRRMLGVSQVRMLPKESGMRPIINLRRRMLRHQNGKMVFGRSTNSILAPAFSALNWEKTARPELLGSALFSVDDMFPRLEAFRTSLKRQGLQDAALYFVKIDVKACFDSIPQARMMQLARTVLKAERFKITKYAKGKLLSGGDTMTPGFASRASWKFSAKASSGDAKIGFLDEVVTDARDGRSGAIYVDGMVQRQDDRRAIVELLQEHIECNVIKVGNKLYRQKRGIPQGSVVSSLLCSLFYAEMEREVLGFTANAQSMLLRLIDDFLLVTTVKEVAMQFVRTMYAGASDFGVEIQVEKSRVNFDVSADGVSNIPRLPAETNFPYCGHTINTTTLDLGKDKERRIRSNLGDSVTVEYSRLPGQNFYRKTLNAMKVQMHAMLMSTEFNSLETVMANQYHVFVGVAQKSYHYMRSLPASRCPSERLVIKTVDELIKLAAAVSKRRRPIGKCAMRYDCAVSAAQTRW